MSVDSMELLSLNKVNLPESSRNGFHYSSLDESFNPDAGSVSQGQRTEDDDTLTDFQGFMLLVPTYVSIGFLGLPYTVKLLGLWCGSGGLLFYGFLNELGALLLAGSTRRITERTGESFGDLGRVAEMRMKLGPPCLQPHAGKFRFSVNSCILVCNALLMPDLISNMNLLGKDFLHQYVDINDTLSIVVISVLLLPVYLTRRMKLLAWLATVGNIVLFGIIIVSAQYICRDLPDISTRSAIKFNDYLTITSFTNDVMFSYGGIVMVRYRMKNKKTFDGWNGVLGLSLMIVTCVHVGCGFFGYLKFGEMTKVNFILNLPGDNWIYKSLKILSFLTLYCTLGAELAQNYGEYICRAILLILSGLIDDARIQKGGNPKWSKLLLKQRFIKPI